MSLARLTPSSRRPSRRLSVVLLCLLALLPSCSRTYYRRQADGDAVSLIRQKANNPHWDIEHYHVQPDAESRMFDPFDPDKEPMPLDDPCAHRYMHLAAGKKGWPHWHRNGDTPHSENPKWLAYLPFNDKGEVVLTAREAVRQGLRNSPTYQRELEEVYLTALDVSFERFRFETQFFAGGAVDYTADGPDRIVEGGDSSSQLTVSTFPAARGIRAHRFFTTGADLVVGFANSLVWQFAGPDDYQGNTLIDFTLVQPLLRDAGRARVMERLTRSERTLLYNVRALERFRQAYYVQILTGRDPGQGPSRSGGVFGGSGLEGFSGVGGGGFGRVATTAAAGNVSSSGAAGAGAQQAGGYLGLLQSQQQIQNQEDNIVRLRDNVTQLETQLLEQLTTRVGADVVLRQRLQVAQARQALINAQSRLLNSRNDFSASLDNFKAVLGLPPELCMEVQDNLIDEFQLINRDTSDLQRQVQRVIDEIGDINRAVLERVTETEDNGRPRRELPWSPELQQELEALRKQIDDVRGIAAELPAVGLVAARKNIDELRNRLDERRRGLRDMMTRFDRDQQEICRLLTVKTIDRRIFDDERLQSLSQRLEQEYTRLEQPANEYDARVTAWREALEQVINEADALPNDRRFQLVRDQVLLAGQNLLTSLRFDILAAQLLQARARTESIQLAKVNLKAEEALRIASKYRHDWMNARAALVDQWRLIEFNANQLRSSLNILFSGDIGNVGQNPFNLQSSTGRLRAGVQFDSPITRLSERNVYRQSLIEYQQARRSYYTFEDSVARGLRAQLRTITANQLNFELQRTAVSQAAEQILLNDDIRARQEATGQAARDTAARDAVSALNDLLDAQNNFMSVFINYEVLRRQLDLDLGTMQLDADGYWLDPGVIDAAALEACEEPEKVPEDLPITDEQIDQIVKELDAAEPTAPLPPPVVIDAPANQKPSLRK